MSKSKKVGLYFLALFLYVSIVGIPFADMQTCELPNGDKVKTRTSRSWYLLKGLNPHGSAWGRKTVKSWYEPSGWLSTKYKLNGILRKCYSYGFYGGVVNLPINGLSYKTAWDSKFKLLFDNKKTSNQLTATYTKFRKQTLSDGYPATLIEILDQGLDRLEDYEYDVMSFVGIFNSSYYYELPLISKPRELIPDADGNIDVYGPTHENDAIIAVWQSHSIDGGKTWSKPIITKDAKLFVIGKSIKEQPGVAKDKGTLKYIGWF